MTPASPPDASATTDGRSLRRDRNRMAVIDAVLALYDSGNLAPSSDDIAERAGTSVRSVFRYFDDVDDMLRAAIGRRSEEHTSELQSLMRISYAVFCLKKKKINTAKVSSPK